MISVGSSSRDGRKGLGFGVGRGMEETELEEGEACSYQEDDASMDPDIALSYIDEKLQDVLGHFQKDFEGGVSAENLGAKFGGYGSFLPTYQRSPVWSQPRTSPKVQNYNTPRSPNSLQLEGGRHNSVVPSNAPLPVRPGPPSTSTVILPASKVSYAHNSVKRDVFMPSSHAEEFTSRYEISKYVNPPDQKSLKVRIKVGSDNLSTQKNAEIYSGLGLDVSPSSSFDDSPSESEGMSREPQDAPDESPNSIVQIMISFPVYGGLHLSPLPDDLIRLTKKEKLLGEGRFGALPKGGQASSVTLLNGSDYIRGDGIALGERKTKAPEKNCFLVELKNGNCKDAQSSCGALLKKEVDADTLDCEELVSKALKLPLISNSYCIDGESTKGTGAATDMSREANKGIGKDKFCSDLTKEDLLEPTLEKPNKKAGSVGRVWEDKKETSVNDPLVYPRKDGNRKGEKSCESVQADANAIKGRTAADAELVDPLKQKSEHKTTSHEQDAIKLPLGKELLSSVGKRKSKGSQSHDALSSEVAKDGLKVGSLVPKNKKSTSADNQASKRELESLKFQKDSAKVRDRYRDFFGDDILEHEENEVDSSEMSSGRLKDSEGVEKSAFAVNNPSKERSSSKKSDKPSTAEAHPKAASNGAPVPGNEPIPDVAPATVPPVVIQENWVCCDKCQKWRLLPFGMNPDNLPEKWLCSMLNWLPGMNHCSFSEEETNDALIARYQAPVPESQNNLQNHPNGIASGVSAADVRHPDRNHQNISFRAVPSGGKKKHPSKEISDPTNQDGPTHFASSMKNIHPSMKSRSLNDVNQSPLVNELDLQHSRKSGDLAVEKPKHKKKEKHKLYEHYSDRGDAKNTKMKSKQKTDQDSVRASKKLKTENIHSTNEDWSSDHGGASRKAGPSSSSSLPTNMVRKDWPKYNDRTFSKDSKYDGEDSVQVSAKKTNSRVQVPLDDGSLVTKKRKSKEFQDSQIYSGGLPITGHHNQESRVSLKEDYSENHHGKEKNARVSRHDGKECSLTRGNGRTDEKGSFMKDQQLGQDLGSTVSQRSLDGTDPLKKDLGSVQPSAAATSSSSKVSGSHKTKNNFQGVKGSPVESVSSSPLRISNPEKLTSARRNLLGKDDSQDAGFLAIGSPRRCSDAEDDGGSDRSGTVRRDKIFNLSHRGSHESSVLDYQERDFTHLYADKAKAHIITSPEFTNHDFMNGEADTNTLGAHTQYPSEPQASDRCIDEDRRNDNHHYANGFRPRKSGKGSSSRAKDKNRSFKSEFDKGKISDSFNDLQDHAPPHEGKPRDGKNKLQEKFGVKSDKVEKKYVDRRSGKLSSESSKKESESNFGGHDGPDFKVDANCSHNATSTPKQNLLLDHDGERTSKRFLSDKNDQVEVVAGRGKSVSLPPSGGGQNETVTHCPRPVPGSHRGAGADILSVDASERDDVLKLPKQLRKSDNQNGGQHVSSRHPTPNGQRVRDHDASSQAATNAVKEAKDLKHLADRLKNSGSNTESTGLYFQAALKFLHGASLLESCNSESAKHGEMIQSMQMYSSTAKLCEFCAHEYEKSKDMAAAALAYKCMEAAYMRVIYSSHSSASKDRDELQAALQMFPPGESPSSSASDVDNLNNPATVDKVSLSKGVSSPQVAGNHVIAARNRPNLKRLLNFAQDVNFAMEASRKSRIAFAAAKGSLEGAQSREGISSIKRALDFNFQDVEGLLRLVRLAMEAISR